MIASPLQRLLHPFAAPDRRPGLQRRMRAHAARSASLEGGPCAAIFREPGRGGLPTVVLGGFVPDATEAVHCQRPLLRRFGDLYLVNYPRAGFDRDALHQQVGEVLHDLRRQGTPPVLFGISFGCSLLAELLDRDEAARQAAGLVWVSPVLSLEDLAGEGGAEHSLVGRFTAPLIEARAPQHVETAVRNGRRFFAKLFSAGSQNRRAMARLRWRRQGEFLKTQIQETLQEITVEGARQRAALLSARCPLRARGGALFEGPALVLFAEREDAVLASTAPARRTLERRLSTLLPAGALRAARREGDDDAVQHASLIFHHHVYNPLLGEFYRGVRDGRRPAPGDTSVPGLREVPSWPL